MVFAHIVHLHQRTYSCSSRLNSSVQGWPSPNRVAFRAVLRQTAFCRLVCCGKLLISSTSWLRRWCRGFPLVSGSYCTAHHKHHDALCHHCILPCWHRIRHTHQISQCPRRILLYRSWAPHYYQPCLYGYHSDWIHLCRQEYHLLSAVHRLCSGSLDCFARWWSW